MTEIQEIELSLSEQIQARVDLVESAKAELFSKVGIRAELDKKEWEKLQRDLTSLKTIPTP